MPRGQMRFDLHVHTTYSDGDCTPRQVIEMAALAGLDGIAITDHDECRGLNDIAGDVPDGLRVFAGIEVSAVHDGGQVHVLGLGIDPNESGILSYVAEAGQKRRERAAKMIDMMQAAEINITMDEVRAVCGRRVVSDYPAERSFDGVIGRPHLAAVLVAKGYAQSVKEVFARFLGRYAPFYVPLERVDVRQAADIIISAGGKPVLAHPGLMSGRVLNALVPQLKPLGFWGIEAYHPAHTNGQCRIFVSMARRRGLYVCAGSDFHGSSKPDITLGGERRGGTYLQRSFCALLNGY